MKKNVSEIRMFRQIFQSPSISVMSSVRSNPLSTSPNRPDTEFKFKPPNTSRRPPPTRAQPGLRDRRTLAYMGLALVATVAAPKVINDVIAMFEKEEDGDKGDA